MVNNEKFSHESPKVGYGDVIPQTDPGRYVGMCVMISGLLIVSFPVGIVGSKVGVSFNHDTIA